MDSQMSKTDKLMILAGAAPGFGEALVSRFADAGYRTAGISRRPSPAAVSALADKGYRHYCCDLADADAVMRTIFSIETEMGAPDVMIYNAMTLTVAPFQDLSVSQFEQSWRSICLGAMVLSQAVLPGMVDRGAGTMIFSGATASKRGAARFAAFASAKFALRGLAEALAREYGPAGIHVAHTILDGLIWGPQTRARFAAQRDACLDPVAIAQTYVQLAQQGELARTFELDLRPWQEDF